MAKDRSFDCKDGVTGYGARQYGYDGWGLAAFAPYTRWVSLMFMRGTDLKDANNMLEGTGKKMRHVKVRTVKELEDRRDALRKMIQGAAELNKAL